LRLNPLLCSFALAILVAACATPGPEPADSTPKEVDITVGPPEPPPVAEAPAPSPPITDPFSSATRAELERLPPPAEDLWARIRRGYVMPDIDNDLVAKWEQWYVARPDYVARMVDRSRRYLYYIVVEVERRGMPLEVALLPMVESAFNPHALSVSRASGIWQFMPSTGTLYGLKQDFWVDSRRDVVAATDSALNYLQKLYADFNDWQLALAAYNWGEGNLARSVAKNESAGLPTDYANLTMPDETRNYLPKLQAIKNIVRDPEKYGIELGDIPDAPYFAIVKTTKKIDVKVAAQLAELSVDEFLYLNPQHNRPVIAGADEYSILLPIDKAELFAAKLELTDQPLVSWQAYRLRNGETLQQVCAKFNIEIGALRAINGIGPRSKVPPGYTLLVPAQGPVNVAENTLKTAVFTTVPQGRTFYYRVNRHDTLAGIATRYDVSTADLKRWNGLSQNALKTGQTLRITSDLAPNAQQAKRAAGRSVSTASDKPKAKTAKAAAKKDSTTKSSAAKSSTTKHSAAKGSATHSAKPARPQPGRIASTVGVH
jgi:membrane-bound lytic murein transglycosylase D